MRKKGIVIHIQYHLSALTITEKLLGMFGSTLDLHLNVFNMRLAPADANCPQFVSFHHLGPLREVFQLRLLLVTFHFYYNWYAPGIQKGETC